jgi:hypothetical protein
MAKSHLKLVAPTEVKRTIAPKRQKEEDESLLPDAGAYGGWVSAGSCAALTAWRSL